MVPMCSPGRGCGGVPNVVSTTGWSTCVFIDGSIASIARSTACELDMTESESGPTRWTILR